MDGISLLVLPPFGRRKIFLVGTCGACGPHTPGWGVSPSDTTGMPVIFDAAIKPTSSIFTEQDTVDVSTMQNAKLQVKGRHDPCIAVRAAVVIEAAASIAVLDAVL